jgi:hypothetical protein
MNIEISPGPVVRRVWEIYRDHSGVLVWTALILFAIEFIFALLLSGTVGVLVVLVFWALSTLYQGMVVELVRDVRDGRRDQSVGRLIRSVEPVLIPLMLVSLLFAIGVFIGFVLIIIPGLILLTIWAVVAPVTVLEHPGVFAAFGRSRELVRGHGWAVFGVIVLIYLAVAVVSVVAGLITGSLGTAGRALVQWAVDSVIAPVPALGASVLYFALLGDRDRTTARDSVGSAPPTA